MHMIHFQLVKTSTERCAHKSEPIRTFADAALFGLRTGLCTRIPVFPHELKIFLPATPPPRSLSFPLFFLVPIPIPDT